MKVVVGCLLALVLVCYVHGTSEDQFSEFVQRFQKSYATEEEYQYRFGVFMNNLKNIEELKEEAQRRGHAYSPGITKFADYSPEEFRLHYKLHRYRF